MLELFVNKQAEEETICLVENGKLVEIYEKIEDGKRKEGNIYVGIVKDILPGMQAAFVDIGTEKNSFIHLKDILPQINQKEEEPQKIDEIDIRDVLKVNDKILVQVKKDSNQSKGARTSTHINLPGRYMVLMPKTDIITISKKIEKQEEKDRLLNILRNNLPENTGAIVRTSAQGKEEEEIVKDLQEMIKIWEKICNKYEESSKNKPELIYQSNTVVEQLILDLLDKNLQKIITNDKKAFEQLSKNEQLKNIEIDLKKEDILEIYELKEQIEKSKSRKIWLNCGGFITIDITEALIAIDVNTGKYTGKKNLEDTIYKVNYEATIEIAKQIRLRDIGGIIIIDYIDMNNMEDKKKIEELLKKCLSYDRAKTQVEGFTKLELMEMTRKHICSHIDNN